MPRTADGDPIPLEADFSSEGVKRSYESEPFYVLPGGNIEVIPNVPCLLSRARSMHVSDYN